MSLDMENRLSTGSYESSDDSRDYYEEVRKMSVTIPSSPEDLDSSGDAKFTVGSSDDSRDYYEEVHKMSAAIPSSPEDLDSSGDAKVTVFCYH
jgi:hypothetical protein